MLKNMSMQICYVAIAVSAYFLCVLIFISWNEKLKILTLDACLNVSVVLVSILSGFVYLNNPISQVSFACEAFPSRPGNAIASLNERLIKLTLVTTWFPNCFEAYNNRGIEELLSGDFIRACDDFDRALEFASAYERPDILENRVYARAFTGDLLGAIKDINELIISGEDDSHYYFVRGQLKARFLDFEGARCDFERAARENDLQAFSCGSLPSWFVYYSLRGRSLYELGEYREALECYSNVCILEEASSDRFFLHAALYDRALCELELGNDKDACADFELARKELIKCCPAFDESGPSPPTGISYRLTWCNAPDWFEYITDTISNSWLVRH